MFPTAKTPKSQKPDNVPLYFHRFHTKEVVDYNAFWTQPYRQLVIIDIGYENLCRRISRRYFLPKKVEALALDKTNVKIETDEEDFRVLFQDIEIFLDIHRQEYLNAHVVIIEWQLPVNYKAVRISTFILAYFYFLLKDTPLMPFILEMRSGFKDEYYPVLKPLNQNARKAKCTELGLEHYELTGDTFSLEVMEAGTSRKKKKKQDDYADVGLMEEVFCRFAAEKGWNFPHYENTRKITLPRRIQEEEPTPQVTLVDFLKEEVVEQPRKPRIQATVTPRRPPQKVKIILKKKSPREED